MEMRTKNCTKISGYLEKKGKRKMIGLYKKYWFVLEGGLLLYYRSKDDYETISPCKGTINLGPPCIVKPCPSIAGVFQLQTRTATITLRAENRDEQTKWMQAIVAEVSPQKAVQRMSHFRYSLESVVEAPRCSHEEIIQRLQRMGAQSYSPLREQPLDSKSSEHIYEMVSRGEDDAPRSSTLPTRRQRSRPQSVLVENEEYATAAREKRPKKKTKSLFGRRDSKEEYFTVVNDNYAGVKKRDQEEMIDHNENKLLDEEDAGRNGEENAYSIPCFFDDEIRNEVLYEDIERNNVEYAEPKIVQEPVQNKKNKKKQEKKAQAAEKTNKVKKRPSFIRRVWRIIEKKDDKKEPTQAIIQKDKPPADDSSALKMLSELQNLLEQKMPVLTEKLATNTIRTKFDSTKQDPDKTKETNLPTLTENPLVEHQMAALPPKKHKKPPEADKSLDEILHELDAQRPEGKEKTVRQLIKRFSEPDFTDDVVLRARRAGRKDDIDADELGRLLQELAKVTSAPVLAPGVTSSLNGASLNDEEFSRLLPMKQRRFSEPDYDVPRPHKSLTLTQKREQISENVIGSTRFFGPILKPVDMIIATKRTCSSSQLHSITPDSLELGDNSDSAGYCKFVDRRLRIKERREVDDFLIENEIYAEPRSILADFGRKRAEESEYEELGEVFVDSLEIYRNEISTNF